MPRAAEEFPSFGEGGVHGRSAFENPGAQESIASADFPAPRQICLENRFHAPRPRLADIEKRPFEGCKIGRRKPDLVSKTVVEPGNLKGAPAVSETLLDPGIPAVGFLRQQIRVSAEERGLAERLHERGLFDSQAKVPLDLCEPPEVSPGSLTDMKGDRGAGSREETEVAVVVEPDAHSGEESIVKSPLVLHIGSAIVPQRR